MNGISNYIISTDQRYNNEENGLVVNTEITERDHEFVNRIGTVVGVPLIDKLGIKVGEKVVVHHNTFRRWKDVYGVEKNTNSYISDGLYTVEQDMIYAYQRDGEWRSPEKYVFVEPIEERTGPLLQRQQLVGTVRIGEHYKGEKVAFNPDSEYEFKFDGMRLYRVYVFDISIILNGFQERERENNQVSGESIG